MDKNTISNLFIQGLLKSNINVDEFKNLINTYSYYISNKNKDYKYNLTYLESYCDDFINIKKYVKEKDSYFNIIVKNSVLKNNVVNIDEINIKMDNFWCYKWNKRENRGDIIHTGIIDEGMLNSNKIYCECECRCNNTIYIDYIIINYLEVNFKKEINDFFRKVFNWFRK